MEKYFYLKEHFVIDYMAHHPGKHALRLPENMVGIACHYSHLITNSQRPTLIKTMS